MLFNVKSFIRRSLVLNKLKVTGKFTVRKLARERNPVIKRNIASIVWIRSSMEMVLSAQVDLANELSFCMELSTPLCYLEIVILQIS